ncbi:MAG: polysaccharide deacetylase family protein [Synergistetes bacterium]|nr:polysaccharide deacetylase family protein [Synergistota bacterium]MDK2872216.1 peptidoglycan-N-acetylglucosamine deacetylase [bacterium]
MKNYLWLFILLGFSLVPILKEKEIFLTFDDGPISPYTMEIAKTLEENQARGTFFLVGEKVVYYGKFTKELAQKGHTIGNHSFSHESLAKKNIKEGIEDIIRAEIVLAEKIGYFTRIYRPPGGRISKEIEKALDSLGFKAVFWDINTLDFEGRSRFSLISQILLLGWDKSIVLMHSCPSTVKALPTLLKLLRLFNFKVKALPKEELEGKLPNHKSVSITPNQAMLLKTIGMSDFIRNGTFLLESAVSYLRNYEKFKVSLSTIRSLERKAHEPEEKAFWEKERMRTKLYIKQSILRRKLLEKLIANILSLPEKAY